MPRIINLPESMIAKIAAGEVIFRPQSVVKELVENSIDAEAKRIKVQTKAGGKALIAVYDDGTGMDREDLLNCYLRHTTSKIKGIEDLEKITSLGFRGEALASIAAVSRLKIASRIRKSETGIMIEIVGGELKKVSEVGMDYGTEIEVSDLFYNLPVRRKFLRSDKWEEKLVSDIVKNYAFAYPEIQFLLDINGRDILNLPQADNRVRIEAITGIKPKDIIKIEGGKFPVRIEGYLSDPAQPKDGASIIYVNRRPIVNRRVSSILRDNYNNKNPFYLLFIDADPTFVDINVHPTKSEVRFHDQRYLSDLIQSMIRAEITPAKGNIDQIMFDISEAQRRPERLFQIHKSYILAEIKDGIIVIDQHAAHERIIYETILKESKEGQPLLFPISVELDKDQFKSYQENVEILQQFGIKTRVFGLRTLIIETTPTSTYLSAQDIIAIFDDLTRVEKKKEEIARVIACHAAIKAGTNLSDEEMARLIDLLFACENPYFCPHGRPTIFRMEIEDLEKRFGRR